MRNRFSGVCFRCGKEVKVGEGFFQAIRQTPELRKKYVGRWLLRCKACVGTGNDLSQITPEKNGKIGS